MNSSSQSEETPVRLLPPQTSDINLSLTPTRRLDVSKFGIPTAVSKTPEYCPFSVEIEHSTSNSFEHLRLSTVNKSWTLAMRTSSRNSDNLLDQSESSEYKEDFGDGDEDILLNQMDLDVQQSLSNHEQAPVGLIPVSSDSESSSRDESLDIDSEDEGSPPVPSTPRRHNHTNQQLPCGLSPRLSRQPPPGASAPLNPLSPLKVLNPGVPQNHASSRQNYRRTGAVTPQRDHSTTTTNSNNGISNNNNALVTVNSGAGNNATTAASNSLAADCMCFAIEDVTQFFCPVTPKSTTLDTACPPGMDCFPVTYDYNGAHSTPREGRGPLLNFWNSSRISPLQPRSREERLAAFRNAKLPRNRSCRARRRHVRKLLAVWHGPLEEEDYEAMPRRTDDFCVMDRFQQRRRRQRIQPRCCYDSDPEQEVLGRWKRRASLAASTGGIGKSHPPSESTSRNHGILGNGIHHRNEDNDDDEPELIDDDETGKQHPRFQKFRPEPFTHLDTDEESCSDGDDDDESSSYQTAKCSASTPSHPSAPRNSDPNISFDFKTLATVDSENNVDIDVNEEETKPLGHKRVLSATSLSTTGHSRFHTIRMSPEQAPEESDSLASSDAFSSLSGSTAATRNTKSATSSTDGKGLRYPLPSYFQSFPTHWTEFQLLFSRNVDEDSVKGHVHELSNVRFPLVWHPGASTSESSSNRSKTKSASKATSSSKTKNMHCPTSEKIASLSCNGGDTLSSSSSNSNNRRRNKGTPFPIAVQGAFEVGAHLEHMVVQPKFTWTPLAQPHRIEKNEGESRDKTNRKLFLSGSAPPQVELLSIIRVNKASPALLDKNLYPYARPDRTCMVSTNDSNHPTIVLEARSTQERDWLVFSLKLIVARLASIIITRDEDMLHEFFSPYSALMQLEEDQMEQEQQQDEQESKPLTACKDESNVECASTPTASCGKAVVVIDGQGACDFVFSEEEEDDDEESKDSEDGDSMDDEEEDDQAYQDRDDREIEDVIRARNSGAYAILKRSLSASGPLVDYETDYHQEELGPRTFSY